MTSKQSRTRMPADHYTYRVTWSSADDEYVGLCLEFPSLSWLDTTPEKALRGIRRTVAGAVTDMRKQGESPPPPLAERRYSGRFLVRIPPEVHRALAMEASEMGVSLNRLVSARLSATADPLANQRK